MLVKNGNETVSLIDALRNGTSIDEVRRAFEKDLQKAYDEVNAEKKAEAEKRQEEANEWLDEARDNMIDAILDYAEALGILPENLDFDDAMTYFTNIVKDIEKEYVAELKLVKNLVTAIDNKFDSDSQKVDKQKKVCKPSADDVIAKFLRELH